MYAPRAVSFPVSIVLTLAVWFAFAWSMQHAPKGSPRTSGDLGEARSRGGLANQFATEVVRFFDDQDPRSVSETDGVPEPDFWGQVPELLPLPQESREAIAKDLPEIYENRSLTARNLFRSDVDLDGDGDLDMALLIRLSRDTAVGAVLSYTPKKRFALNGSFRLAGKFTCKYKGQLGFERCFQVIRTGAGSAHIASYGELISEEDETVEQPSYGWRLFRLEEEKLVEKLRLEDTCSSRDASQLMPVGNVEEDLLLHTQGCAVESCQVWHYTREVGKWTEAPGSAHCEDAD